MLYKVKFIFLYILTFKLFILVNLMVLNTFFFNLQKNSVLIMIV